MAFALQVCGGIIVAAALVQAGIGLISQITAAFRSRKMDRRKVAFFQAQTENLIKQAEVDRERAEQTWSGKRKFRIVERRVENKEGSIRSFYLAPHDGGKLPTFQPGQFLTFELAIPNQPAPVIRCYSLSDSPVNRDRYRISIKKLPPPPKAEPGTPGGLSSNYFHDVLREGDVVDVMAPNGGFHLDTQSDRPVVLIAGGVGLTPVFSMLKWLADTGSHREVWFFYAVRHGGEIALKEEIDEIIASHSNYHGVTVFSDPTEECVEGKDYDCCGFLSLDVIKQYLKSSNYEFYICGPPPMMQSITGQLEEWGVPEQDIRFEAFGPASVKKAAKSDGTEGESVAGVNVSFTRSGKSAIWKPDAGTLLDLAEANGVRINSGCRAGNCGTCLTALKDGKVSYIAKPASPLAQGSTLVCVAQPVGDVALDA